MTKLDAKTVIKGDGEENGNISWGRTKAATEGERLGLKMLIIAGMKLTGRRSVMAEWSRCWC